MHLWIFARSWSNIYIILFRVPQFTVTPRLNRPVAIVVFTYMYLQLQNHAVLCNHRDGLAGLSKDTVTTIFVES